VIMKKTRFGRYVYAIGGNEEAALYSGVPVTRCKLRVWALHGLLVGLAAVVLTSRAVSGHATLGEGLELESIAATVIGGTALGRGRGGIFNTFLGVLAMGLLTNGLNLLNVSTYYQMVLIGIIIASLVNIFREYSDDLGYPTPANGDLTPWAERGVLLLNRVLTVQPGKPGSHRGKGWEEVTDQAIRALAERKTEPLVAILWGRDARTLVPLLGDIDRIESAHPSPYSAASGFFGSRPFSRANQVLEQRGTEPVDWKLP